MNEYIFINTYMQVNFYMVTFTEQCINEKRNILHVKKMSPKMKHWSLKAVQNIIHRKIGIEKIRMWCFANIWSLKCVLFWERPSLIIYVSARVKSNRLDGPASLPPFLFYFLLFYYYFKKFLCTITRFWYQYVHLRY